MCVLWSNTTQGIVYTHEAARPWQRLRCWNGFARTQWLIAVVPEQEDLIDSRSDHKRKVNVEIELFELLTVVTSDMRGRD